MSKKPLGKGAYGKVYLCRVPLPDGSDVTAVLKRMHRTTQEAVVLSEVAAMERLRGCGGCVQLLAHGVHGGRRALLLEYCAGGSLADRLEQQDACCGRQPTRLLTPVPALRELAAQRLRGLANVHASGVIHQDIKPDNLLFDQAGELRIADFGTAAPRMDDGMYDTAGAGSRTYMAPEALALVDGKPCQHPVTDKADVYSVGATLLEAAWLYTDPAFRFAFMRGLNTTVPQFVPPSLLAFLSWLTHPDPSQRPSAREALESGWVRGSSG
ncbi:hypothetical protein HYH03_000010 [Edaphochlamys debaryana]|uniref:Protein kinase domain-containing protein n=1 Tax=Edaphochlamys debaryana TaxID=47281 RepID=A0A835YGS3_9CHLO|nr:hypothetical protein HYH03_000010 [Edaphochlamys debaryana]|eukprot:KAG2501502.1 hypothetical protein HYH03_000010 [Edaphochlamys debaryana]